MRVEEKGIEYITLVARGGVGSDHNGGQAFSKDFVSEKSLKLFFSKSRKVETYVE